MKNNIPLSQIKAIIFDMDELMVNSAAVHKIVFEKVLNKYGVSFNDPSNSLTKDEEASWYGRKIIDLFAFFVTKYKLENQTTAVQLNEEFNKLLLPIFGEQVEEMPGIRELIFYVKDKYKLAVASSAPMAKIMIVFQKLDINNVFVAVVSGEDMHLNGKPEPDIFLEASKTLRVDPQNCLVLEDAKNGVEAAKAAGMYCIGVHNKFTLERVGLKQDLSKADVEVENLYEVIKLLESYKQT